MTAAKKYFTNALLMTAVALVMRLVSVAFNVFVSRRLGADGMGLLALVSSAYGFAVTFATSGISLAVTRMTAECVLVAAPGDSPQKLRRVMSATVKYCVFFGVTGGLFLFFGADFIGTRLLGDASTVRCLRLLSFTLLPTSLCSALSGYFSACRRVWKNAFSDLTGQILKIFLTSALLAAALPQRSDRALIAVVGGGAVAEAASFFVSLVLYIRDRRRYFAAAPVPRTSKAADTAHTELSADSPRDAARSLCGAALPVALSSYLRSGLVTLEHMLIPYALRRSGSTYTQSLSSYGVVHGMAMPVIMFPYAVIGPFSSLLVPELSESRARGQTARIRHIADCVFRVTLLFGVGVSGIMVSFSHELGELLYHSEEAGYYIRMLAPVIPVMYLDTAVDSMLKGLGEQLFCMRVNIADAALSVAMVWFLVPRLGVAGYAATVVITEVFNASVSIWKLLTVADVKPRLLSWTMRPVIASVLSATAVRFLIDYIQRLYRADGVISCSLFITAAVAMYVFMLAATDSVNGGDAAYIRKIFTE